MEPDQEVLFADADRTFADSHLANIDSLLGSDSREKQENMFGDIMETCIDDGAKPTAQSQD